MTSFPVPVFGLSANQWMTLEYLEAGDQDFARFLRGRQVGLQQEIGQAFDIAEGTRRKNKTRHSRRLQLDGLGPLGMFSCKLFPDIAEHLISVINQSVLPDFLLRLGGSRHELTTSLRQRRL
jgi:hypothetical protein